MTHNHITAVPTIVTDLFFIFFPVHGPFPRVSPKALFHVRWWWVSQILRGFRMSCSVLKPAAFLLPPSTQDRRGGSLGITEVPWQCSPPRMSSFPVLEDLGFEVLSFSNDSIIVSSKSLWSQILLERDGRPTKSSTNTEGTNPYKETKRSEVKRAAPGLHRLPKGGTGSWH